MKQTYKIIPKENSQNINIQYAQKNTQKQLFFLSQSDINDNYQEIQNFNQVNVNQIFVMIPNGRILSLDINDEKPYLEQINQQIEQKEGIPSNRYNLFLGPKHINSSNSKKIKKFSTLHLRIHSEKNKIKKHPQYFIYVIYQNKTLIIEVNLMGFVSDIKHQLEKQYKFPKILQQLYLKNIQLQDDQNLQYYNINQHSIFFLKLKEQIYIYLGSKNKIIREKLNDKQKIKDLKISLIQKYQDLKDYHVFYENQILDENKTLQFYNIIHESIIELIGKQYINFTIQIQCLILPMKIEQFQKILDIKKEIQQLLEFPINQQHLFYKGQELNDNETVQSKIEQDSNLYLFNDLKSPYKITIINKIDNCKEFTVTVSPNDKVFQLKYKICLNQECQVPPEKQQLKFQGKFLKDYKDLSYYNIENFDYIILEKNKN
ncbi:unnamed protein product [Paramecium sonneborni]|uniref:Ubiquitin-like domain-containing protein n=1 Tax=Paramecium sonneborni TaxID=65129 RepID=A0A8S1JTS4_9CILI|nr:unnamed protein product [Paramecium sonneborni]